MIKIIKMFFIVLGVIFFTLLLSLTYFFITDPYNLRPTLMPIIGEMVFPNTVSDTNTTDSETNTSSSNNSTLSPAQKQVLESIGVNPDSLPSTITPSQEVCFVGILGQARVNEVKGGVTLSAMEFFKASSCLK